MEKLIRRFNVDYNLSNWEYPMEISKLKKDIEELEKLGTTHVEITPYWEHDMTGITARAYSKRSETDEEYNDRISLQKRKVEQQEEFDLAELERLKTKYNL